ncbi:MAG: hypothetical protein ACD_82C00080G0001 [uncultured bacterium]|nr:MAG: hypothetical protein ACD_82C00080G0001 [uncultured bacterium]
MKKFMFIFALLIFLFTGIAFAMEIEKDIWVEIKLEKEPNERTNLVKSNGKKHLNFFKNRISKRPIIGEKDKYIYYVNNKKNDISCFNIFKILFCCDKN